MVVLKVDKNEEGPHEDDAVIPRRFGNEMNIAKSNILAHFLKGKIAFTSLETIMTILGEL
jgi:hypothetical protein